MPMAFASIGTFLLLLSALGYHDAAQANPLVGEPQACEVEHSDNLMSDLTAQL